MNKEDILKLRQKAVEFTEIDDLPINLSVPAKHVLFLIDENKRLREALEKYANPETHSMDESGFVWHGDYFDYETARAALEPSGD